jgi:CBS domain-containing protein
VINFSYKNAMNFNSKHSIRISTFFTPENIEFFQATSDTNTIINKLLKNLALNYGIGNVNKMYQNFIESNSYSSSLTEGNYYRIVTFQVAETEKTRIALGFINSAEGNQHNEISEIILVIAYFRSNPDIALKLLKAFTTFFNEISHIKNLNQLTNSTDIWNYIDRTSGFLPDIILVDDFMENVDIYLKESNNLKDAINMFIKTGLLNIPVIDLEWNLIGEVTARELMEVCLPRYILWMDDIDPIVHFEPFRNMLEQEDNTWLAEILNYNAAVVQKGEPLMKAAIQMTKKEVSHVYVLDDKKLIGRLTLQYFLNRILRA